MRRKIEIKLYVQMYRMDTYMLPWKQFDDRSLYDKGFAYLHTNKHTYMYT